MSYHFTKLFSVAGLAMGVAKLINAPAKYHFPRRIGYLACYFVGSIILGLLMDFLWSKWPPKQ